MRSFALPLIFVALPLFIGAQEKPDAGASLQKGNGSSQLQANSNDKTDSNKKFIMAENGAVKIPIILYENAPPRTKQAAKDLSDYMAKICGSIPNIIEGRPDPLPQNAIWVGFQPELKNLFPKIDFDFKYPEEIIIATDGKNLVIAGRDRWDPALMNAKGRLAEITGRQQEYGTANAVYTFLQDYLNVRWIFPGEFGEDIIPQKDISFAPFEYRYHPQIRGRIGIFVRLSLGNTKENPAHLWARYQRDQLDSFSLEGGHGFGDWWKKYSKSHPEYFALQPDGTRSGYPSPNTAKLCNSNPAVWDQWLFEVEEQIKADPGKYIFNVSPNDSWSSGHCVCEKCRAWDNPKGEMVTYHWKGKKEDRPALSDAQVTFANTLARMLKKRFPDKEYYVQLHAYGLSRPPPVAAVPDDNVIISSVSNFHLTGAESRPLHMSQFEGWAKKAKLMAWRPNIGNPAGFTWGMPDVDMTEAGKDFRFAADNKCISLYFDMLWGHWSTQGPYYYIIFQLAWNPYINVQAVMDDYYKRAFGPASQELKQYWELMEKTRHDFVSRVPNKNRVFGLPSVYTPEFFAKAGSLLEKADAKLAGADDKYKKRVDFVRRGFEFTRLLIDTRTLMQKFEESNLKDSKTADKVKQNWVTADKMRKEFPPFAINFNAVFLEKEHKRMTGLHPDNPLAGKQKKEFESLEDLD